MKTLLEIKNHARNVRVRNRAEWLDGVKTITASYYVRRKENE